MELRRSRLRCVFPDRMNIVVFDAIMVPAAGRIFGVINIFNYAGNYTFNRTQAEAVVEEIRSGKLHPNSTDEVAVPENLVSTAASRCWRLGRQKHTFGGKSLYVNLCASR